MLHPALSVTGADPDIVLAVADDYSPAAAQSGADSLTLFFREKAVRDAASAAIRKAFPTATVGAHEVDDEDWARRSQEDLQPVIAGRLVILPRPDFAPVGDRLAIVIPPSMAFGTGHHATTRMCLLALQTEPLANRTVLDVGTGSGVLAIAAVMLGAAAATGIDNDPDAIHAARQNLALNPPADGVRFALGDVTEVTEAGVDVEAGGDRPVTADVVTANLTGTLLRREAHRLARAVRPGGCLIVSGILAGEREDVLTAFPGAAVAWEQQDAEWLALVLRPGPNGLAPFPV